MMYKIVRKSMDLLVSTTVVGRARVVYSITEWTTPKPEAKEAEVSATIISQGFGLDYTGTCRAYLAGFSDWVRQGEKNWETRVAQITGDIGATLAMIYEEAV